MRRLSGGVDLQLWQSARASSLQLWRHSSKQQGKLSGERKNVVDAVVVQKKKDGREMRTMEMEMG
jgi:hypothetical protein